MKKLDRKWPKISFLSSAEEHTFEIGRCTHHAKTVFVDGKMFLGMVVALDYFKKYMKELCVTILDEILT